MNRFDLRDPDTAESELDIYIRQERRNNVPEKEIVDAICASIGDVAKAARGNGYEAGFDAGESKCHADYESGYEAGWEESEDKISTLEYKIQGLEEKIEKLEASSEEGAA